MIASLKDCCIYYVRCSEINESTSTLITVIYELPRKYETFNRNGSRARKCIERLSFLIKIIVFPRTCACTNVYQQHDGTSVTGCPPEKCIFLSFVRQHGWFNEYVSHKISTSNVLMYRNKLANMTSHRTEYISSRTIDGDREFNPDDLSYKVHRQQYLTQTVKTLLNAGREGVGLFGGEVG